MYNFVTDKTNLSVIIIVTFGLLFVVIRRRNRITIDLNEDDDLDEDYEQNYDQDYDLSNYQSIIKTVIHDSDDLTAHVEDTPILSESLPDEQRPLDRRAFNLTDNEEFVEQKDIKRRTGRIQRNAQGPIMSTKRKRLDGKLDIPGAKIISKKTSVKKL